MFLLKEKAHSLQQKRMGKGKKGGIVHDNENYK